jgi:hypothetical protein
MQLRLDMIMAESLRKIEQELTNTRLEYDSMGSTLILSSSLGF